jgi:hypothetical protein
MPTIDISVDFSRIGCATQFTVLVRDSVRALLHDGDAVTVSGDDVEPMPARVLRTSADDPAVEFLLLVDWVPTPCPCQCGATWRVARALSDEVS